MKYILFCFTLFCMTAISGADDDWNIRIRLDWQSSASGSSTIVDPFGEPGAPAEEIVTQKRPVVCPTKVIVQGNRRVIVPAIPQFVSRPKERPMARYRNSSSQETQSMFLVVGNGMSAMLWSGEMLVDPQWLAMQSYVPEVVIVRENRPPLVIPGADLSDVQWAETGAKLAVTPYYDPKTNTIELEIYPRVAYITGKGKRRALRVKSLSTRIRVRNGERVYIGGFFNERRNDFLSLFGRAFYNDKNSRDMTSIYLTCSAVRVPSPPAPKEPRKKQ